MEELVMMAIAILLLTPFLTFYVISVSIALTNKLVPLPISRNEIQEFPWFTHIFYIILSLVVITGMLKVVIDNNIFGINLYFYMPWMPLLLIFCSIRSNPLWIKSFLSKPKILIFRSFNSKAASLVLFRHFRNILTKYGRCYALFSPYEHEFSSRERRFQLIGRLLPNINLNNQIRTIKLKDSEWKTFVKLSLTDTQLVVFHIDDIESQNVFWELETAFDMLGKERVIIIYKDSREFASDFFNPDIFPNIIKYKMNSFFRGPKRLSKLRSQFKFLVQNSIQSWGSIPSVSRMESHTPIITKKDFKYFFTLFRRLLFYLFTIVTAYSFYFTLTDQSAFS